MSSFADTSRDKFKKEPRLQVMKNFLRNNKSNIYTMFIIGLFALVVGTIVFLILDSCQQQDEINKRTTCTLKCNSSGTFNLKGPCSDNFVVYDSGTIYLYKKEIKIINDSCISEQCLLEE